MLFNILVHEKGPGFFSKGVDREVRWNTKRSTMPQQTPTTVLN